MAANSRPIGAKLFLEGKEVPFIGATINHAVNQASIAYIDVVPHVSMNGIKPRTLVQLFVRDPIAVDNSFPFILAWEGEVFGYNMGRTPNQRTMSLSCVDFTGYWDNVYSYFFNAKLSMSMGPGEIVSAGQDQQDAAAEGLKTTAGTSWTGYMHAAIKQHMGTSNDFLDGVVGLYKDVAGVNDFYQAAEKRLRIVDRIIMQSGKATADFLKWEEARTWILGIVDRGSGWVSLRHTIQDLMSLVFHDTVSLPAPAKVAKNVPSPSADSSSKSVTKTIGSLLFKPNLFMVAPPLCNTFFPEEYSSFQYSRNFFKEPTRLIYKPTLPVVLTKDALAMQHEYQPDSYAFFMRPFAGKNGTKTWSDFVDEESDLAVDKSYQGKDKGSLRFGAKTDKDGVTQGVMRMGQFLTNEEKYKGIWYSQESVTPANQEFLQSALKVQSSMSTQLARYLFFKKRFQDRSLQTTSHLKLSVVPGFNVLLLDDGESGQNIVAYCSSVTHRIYATQGGYTNVQLSYARTVGEEAVVGSGNNPPIPPWLKKEIFGSLGAESMPTEDAAKEIYQNLFFDLAKGKSKINSTIVHPAALGAYYQSLLGEKGSTPLSLYKNQKTLEAALATLIADYREYKKKGIQPLAAFISGVTRRDYVSMDEAFGFIGASLKGKSDEEKQGLDKLVEYKGDLLEGKGLAVETQVKKRREIVDAYRAALTARRAFRG